MKTVTFWAKKHSLLVACALACYRRFVVQGTSYCTPFLAIMIMAICISLLPGGQAYAQPPEQPPQLVAIDNFITNVLFGPTPFNIESKQAGYIATHGGYWQGLNTHSSIPSVTGPGSIPDRLGLHPTDQAESWEAVSFSSIGPLKCSITVDVYEAPTGHGYCITVITDVAGEIWQRVINKGPETGLEQSWTDVSDMYGIVKQPEPVILSTTFVSPLEQ